MFSLLERLNLPLGKWFDIPVSLHWTWVLMFSLVLWTNPPFAIVYASVFFIVLLHEFGHCLAGRYYNMMVKSITLYPIGGVARMEVPSKPMEELVMAIAGPAVNVALIPVFWVAQHFYTHSYLEQIAYINVMLFLFNMLPAFPMDGGRVFRALLVLILKNYDQGTTIAVRVGQVFALLFVAGAFMVGNPWLILIGVFVLLASQSEIEGLAERRHVREMHELVTGIKTPPTIENDVRESARMIEEIQRRLAVVRHDE